VLSHSPNILGRVKRLTQLTAKSYSSSSFGGFTTLINQLALDNGNLKTQLDSYVSVNERQKQVTGQLQNILPEQVPEAKSEREFLADTIRDTFPPEFLYHPDVLACPTTHYHVIRGVLLVLSRPFNQARITGMPARVSLGVARQMYEDEDAELALEMAESFFRITSV
jgi:hypothetical protein